MKIPLLVMLSFWSGISPLPGAVPELSANESDAVIAAANQAVHQHVRADPQDREGTRIAEKFWGEAISKLKPLRVMMDRMNTMIVLGERDGEEEGFYVTNPISSYAPGHDGRFATFETVRAPDREKVPLSGTLYHYRITASAKKEQAAVGNFPTSVREKIEEMIRKAPVTTNYLADIFELTPGSRSEYQLRSDIISMPIPAAGSPGLEIPQGTVFHLPAGKKFYIQWDGLGASTLHYYGPFYGNPTEVLELPGKPETSMNADVPEFQGFELKMSEEKLNRLIAERGLKIRVSEVGGTESYHVSRNDGENVIVMFRDGECTGIQRMRRDPRPSTSSDALPPLDGKSSKGLKLECRPVAEKFATDQLVQISCRVTNTTDETKPVGWSVNGGAHFLLQAKTGPRGGTLPSTSPRLDGSLVIRDGYPPFSMKILYLPPGRSVEINLNCGYFEKPQRFEGRIVYDPLSAREMFIPTDESGTPPWTDELVSSAEFSFEVAAASSGKPGSGFGPAGESAIKGNGGNCWALNLASGKVVTSTEERPLDFRVGGEDALRKAGIDLYQPIYANAGYLVKTLDMLVVPLDPGGWEMTADQVRGVLKNAGESWNFVKADAWVDSHKIPVAFRTRDGVEGIFRVPEAGPSTLHYKLLRTEK